MCGGSPRVAHVVGQNLREHPDDPLRGDGIARIWVRYLAGDVDQNSDQYQRRHLVLSAMALFKRFGWSPPVRAGAYEVYDLIISKLDGGLSKAQFGAIINQMVARKILRETISSTSRPARCISSFGLTGGPNLRPHLT
jgi:hypothetical protein